MYLIQGVETSDVGAGVVTDRHTDTHTDRYTDTTHSQDKYRNPSAHAHRGLITCMYVHTMHVHKYRHGFKFMYECCTLILILDV